jgi:drug/metabolite transporter (DMT)-like permease
MAISLKFAPASTTAPFEYTSLIFATAIGFVFFGDMPGINILTGGLMVITAGLVIIWRENRRGKSRKAEAGVVPSM